MMQKADCPPEGCVQVQYLAKRLEDSAELASECLDKTAEMHSSLQNTLTRVETIVNSQAQKMEKIGQLEIDVAILKDRKGASTGFAATIATGVAAGISTVIHFFMEK